MLGSPGLAMKCIELKCLPFSFSIFKHVGFIFTLRYSCFKMMTYTAIRLYLCFDYEDRERNWHQQALCLEVGCLTSVPEKGLE